MKARLGPVAGKLAEAWVGSREPRAEVLGQLTVSAGDGRVFHRQHPGGEQSDLPTTLL